MGTAVGMLSAIDPDAGDSFTYSLVAGTGDTDNSSFTITGTQLKTAQSFDYETKSSYSIRVRVTDSTGNPFEKALTINVTDVNEHTGPTIVSLSPVNNASGVPISSNLTMTFNEAVTTASGNIYIVRNSDDAIVKTIAASSQSVVTNGAIVTIDLPADLTSGVAYHVKMDAGAFKNAAQQDFQGIADAMTWGFTTVTQSANADLSGLTLSQGILSPAFALGMMSYNASVPNSVTGITVTPTAADNKSKIQINGATVTNGQASSNISLNPGLNTITIVVTAQNGDINTYVVEVERAIAATTEPAPTVPANIVMAEDTRSGSILIMGGLDTKFFIVNGITGGKLYKANGPIEIRNGDFITTAEGSAGLQFMPNLDANGTTGFGFNVQAARDNVGAGLSSATMVQIKVTEVNDAPTIAIPISNLQIIAGKSNSIDVSNTFLDVDGDTLTLTAASSASNVASVQLNQQQLTIQGLAVGTADITVIAIDNHGATVTDTFTVVITNTNPVFPNPTITETVVVGNAVSGMVAATDTDGHLLMYSLVTPPAYGAVTIISNATWIYVNTSSLAGNESFKIQVSDGYGGTAIVTVNIAVTAPSHTVSFNVDGGIAVAPQTIADGGKVTTPAAPTKAGYTFGGWYTSNAYTTVFDFNSTITANTVVYAKWITTPVPHTVSFDVDGGSMVAPQTIVDGGKVTAPAAPTKAGYTFGGWYKETSFATEWNFATDIVDANTTLYARWIRDVTPPTDSEAVAKAKAALVIGYSTGDSATSVTQKLTLPVTGEEGTTVSWTPGNPAVVTANGVVQRPSVGDSTVILTATIVKGNVKETKQFIVVVKGYNDRYPPVTSTPDSPPSNTEQVVLDIVSRSGGVVSKVIIKRTKNADGTFNDVVTLTEQSARDAVAKLKDLGLATARLILSEQQDKVNELYVSIPKDVVTILRSEGVNLEIGANNARILIPVSSFEALNEDVYFRILAVSTQVGHSEILERARKEASGIEGVDSTVIHILGRPMKIETNLQNRPVDLTLPLPADVTQEQLSHLAIYIEHSDGTKEMVSGKVVTLADGKRGIQFTVQKFSTFTVLYMPKKEVVEEEVPEEILPEEAQIPYIQGYIDGTFRPNTHITRAQMAAMLARNLSDNDVPASSKFSYSDTAASWAKDEIEYVRTQGIMNGRADGKFDPNEAITRAQMAAIAIRWIDKQCAADDTAAYCTGDTTNITFNDVNSQHWAATYIEKISALGIMTGMNASRFNPEGTLTRAQAVKVLNRLFERDLATNEVPLFSDVPRNHWAFDEIQAAAKK